MGTDWHPYLETKQADGYWAPTWKPIPHPQWWYEDLLERKLEDGSFALMWPKVPKELPKVTTSNGVFFTTEEIQTDSDDDVLWKVARNYYRSMPMGEVIETIEANDIYYLWREHTDGRVWDQAQEMIRLNQHVPEHWDPFGSERFSARDYGWFSLFGLRTSSEAKIDIQGTIPDDASTLVKRIYKRMRGDAHTAGYINVSELCSRFASYRQIKWLKRNVEDPENTRLIFWFDN